MVRRRGLVLREGLPAQLLCLVVCRDSKLYPARLSSRLVKELQAGH